jgi:Tol biopolymer transport system component
MLIPLDGTDPITIGQGSWAAISPDGHKVAYAYEGLRVMDVDTGQTSLLIAEDSSYAMAWSSDGQRLAFIRGGDGVYTINADGSGLQRSPGASADMIGIAGWLPDGERIVVSRVSAGGTLMQILDLSSGETEDLFLIDSLKGGFTHLSPDGTHVVYSAGVFGEFNPGVYVADLDGSNQRLLAEPGDDFMFTSGAWSPDSKQLILNPYDVASYRPEPQHPIVVNVDTCQLSVMEQLLGEVKGWAP